MKIVQNPESGEVGIQYDQNEKYDRKEHLQTLTAFVTQQALKTYELTTFVKSL
jgi:hypothetical protein